MNDLFSGFYQLEKRDLSRAGAVISDAFKGDPLWEILLSEATTRQKQASFLSPLSYCLYYGNVFAPTPDIEGVAAWMEGQAAGFSLWHMLRSHSLRYGLQMGFPLAKKMEYLFAPLIKDMAEHMKDRSFIYLQILGVSQANQGKGYGSAMLKALITKSEEEGRPIYLETETERNVAYYENFNFRVLGKTVLTGTTQPMWEMMYPNH